MYINFEQNVKIMTKNIVITSNFYPFLNLCCKIATHELFKNLKD